MAGVWLKDITARLSVRQGATLADTGALARPAAQDLPSTAFASFAHEDEAEVLGRVASLRALGIDVYVGRPAPNGGERWSAGLEREIVSRDAFVLFWSTAAAASSYVRREWKTALDARGLECIRPIALDRSALPDELKELHLGSLASSPAKGPN